MSETDILELGVVEMTTDRADRFTNQEPRIATKEECEAPWSGYRDGSRFRCRLCGHKFQVGDQWRWVYGKEAGNFMVCSNCDTGDNEDLKAKVTAAWARV